MAHDSWLTAFVKRQSMIYTRDYAITSRCTYSDCKETTEIQSLNASMNGGMHGWMTFAFIFIVM